MSRAARVLGVLRCLALLAVAAQRVLPYRDGRLPLDLHVYLVGGRAVLHGADLYGPAVGVQGYPFTYPPLAALPFALLAAGPSRVAVVLTVLLFFVSLALVVSLCSPGIFARAYRGWRWWLVLVVVVSAEPVWATLKDGQINMLLAALVLVDLLRCRGSRAYGALVGVAAAIKLTPAVFVLYLLATRQLAAARNAALAFVAAGAASWLVLPGDSRRYWLHSLFQTSRVGDVARVSNQSLSGLAHREFSSAAAVGLAWVLLDAVVAAATLWVCARLTADGRRVLAVGLAGVLTCLLSPISWTHHWVWFVPVLIGVVDSPFWAGRWCRVLTALGCAAFLYGASRPPPGQAVAHLVLGNLFVLPALLTIGSLCVAVARAPAAVNPEGEMVT